VREYRTVPRSKLTTAGFITGQSRWTKYNFAANSKAPRPKQPWPDQNASGSTACSGRTDGSDATTSNGIFPTRPKDLGVSLRHRAVAAAACTTKGRFRGSSFTIRLEPVHSGFGGRVEPGDDLSAELLQHGKQSRGPSGVCDPGTRVCANPRQRQRDSVSRQKAAIHARLC